jgi:hypothetical protein
MISTMLPSLPLLPDEKFMSGAFSFYMNKKDTKNQKSVKMKKRLIKPKPVKMLPKTTGEITNGGLYSQRVRCGKQNCKCSRGELHTGFYFFTRRNGKLIKIYVRKSEVEQIILLTAEARAERKQTRRTTESALNLLKEMRADLREKQSLVSALKTDQTNDYKKD